jgi:hypothetical protein
MAGAEPVQHDEFISYLTTKNILKQQIDVLDVAGLRWEAASANAVVLSALSPRIADINIDAMRRERGCCAD